MAQLLDQMEHQARLQAGDTIGEVEGVKFKARRNSSMVHRNGVTLPERTPVYDRNGMVSMVPTAQLLHHLSKRTIGGERAFYASPPNGAAPPKPIDDTCEWCLKRGTRKVFYDIDDLENHCETYHPQEYNRKLRREQGEQKALDTTQIIRLLATLTPEQRENLLGVTQ